MAAEQEGKEKEFEVKEQRVKGITMKSKRVNDDETNMVKNKKENGYFTVITLSLTLVLLTLRRRQLFIYFSIN